MSRFPPSHVDKEDLVSPDDFLFEAWLLENENVLDYEDYLIKIIKILKSVSLGDVTQEQIKNFSLEYKLNDQELLFRRIGNRYVLVPKIKERESILKEVHDCYGDFGQEATWKRLYWQYWWPDAYAKVELYVLSCEKCQMFSNLPDKYPLIGQVPVEGLFQKFGVDYIGPFPTSKNGNKYVILAVEYYTGWPIGRAV